MWRHLPVGTFERDRAAARISAKRGGLRLTWLIPAALVALLALNAPAGAQTPASDPVQTPAGQSAPSPAGESPAPASQSAPSPSADSAPASQAAQATLSLSAVLNGGGAPLAGGLRWRVFAAQTDPDGSRPLVVESSLAQPTLTIPAGDYVVHVAFGLASTAKRVTLGAEVRSERLTLSAGALKIEGTLADAPIDPSKLSLAIYVPQNRNPLGKLVYAKGKAGDIIGLPEGSYHIVSTFLDTVGAHSGVSAAANTGKSAAIAPPAAIPSNSIVNADIKVMSGKRIDVTIKHRCATLTLKLVNKPGAEALANTTFTVLTPGGDVIRELVGAFPALVLAEGEYVVIARHESKVYQSTFQVQTGMDRDVEVVAEESGKQGP
jgi:hypothetical protein